MGANSSQPERDLHLSTDDDKSSVASSAGTNDLTDANNFTNAISHPEHVINMSEGDIGHGEEEAPVHPRALLAKVKAARNKSETTEKKKKRSLPEPEGEDAVQDSAPKSERKKKRRKRSSPAPEKEDAGNEGVPEENAVDEGVPEPTETPALDNGVPGPKRKEKRRRRSPAPEEEDAVNEEVPEPAETPARGENGLLGRSTPMTPGLARGVTGAQAELERQHKLNRPLDIRPSGDFSEDERELIRRQIRQYQQVHGLEVSDLVALIQYTKPYRTSGSRPTADEASQIAASTQFWTEIYEVLPERKNNSKSGTTSIQRFVRRKYHQFKGSGGWTEEEDETLLQLHEANPHAWKMISQTMGDRDPTACRDRWRNYLQYGDTRATSTWSEEEIEKLERAVAAAVSLVQKERADAGKEPLEEYSTRDISWQAVAARVGSRSRLQCLMKWKILEEKKEREGLFPSETQPKKKKKQKKRAKTIDELGAQHDMTNGEGDEGEEVAQEKRKRRRQPKSGPGFKKMGWGDKLDVLAGVTMCNPSSPHEIDWDEVAAKSGGTPYWTTKDRKAVLKELLGLVGEKEDEEFTDTLGRIVTLLQEQYIDQLQQRYDPALDEAANHEDEDENAAAEGSSLKKRKRKSKVGARGTGGTPAEKKKFKSSNVVTMSDDEL